MSAGFAKNLKVFPEAAEDLLRSGHWVRFSAPGHSMHPTIKPGDALLIEPCDPAGLSVGDIALFKQHERLFAHRIVHIAMNADPGSRIRSFGFAGAARAAGPLSNCRRRPDAPQALRFTLRGDCRPHPDPPISARQIFGKVVAVERHGRLLSPYGCGRRLFARAYRLFARLSSRPPL